MKFNKIAIIQARFTSSRLPGKVLMDIGGQSMLVRVVERVKQAKTIDNVVVATTTDTTDNAVEALCVRHGYPCYRGSNHDVLDRYLQTAKIYNAEVVIRITADCPIIDPHVIDKTVDAFLGKNTGGLELSKSDIVIDADHSPPEFPYDFAANRLPPPWGRTYPIGLDTEVCAFQGLELAWKEADLPHQREHVMPFFYDQPDRFRILHITHDPDYGSLRWTVDTGKDLELLRQIFASFPGRNNFTWLEVLELFEQHPEMAQINAEIKAKNYQEIDDRSGISPVP
ncbi:cytidylyltransferase domain-containing protein [Chloroflexota bacterium]